jgi:glycosyltransferase involved in cell wall biosynthesis
MRVAYLVKRYPRYSETFIVNELLAHEAAGLDVEVFSVYPPNDTHFQDVISQVRAPLSYLPMLRSVSASDGSTSTPQSDQFWSALREAKLRLPSFDVGFEAAQVTEHAESVYSAVALAQALHEKGIQHVHAHFASKPAGVARLAAAFAGVPYTFTAHAKDLFHESVDAERLERKIRGAAAVITVSDYNATYLRTRYPVAADKLHRIYNGLDLERFPFTSPSERPATIVAVGRLIEKKGFGDLVQACAKLASRGKRFRCQIIGTGPLAGDLDRQIDASGLSNRVELLGPRAQAEVATLVQKAAAFAAPCVIGGDGNRDGLPTVLLEAMALGTPCISTDVTGIPEVVRDQATGLQVPQRDPERLAEAIDRLLGDPALRVRLATAARRLIETEFDVHRNAARLRAVFDTVQGAPLARAAGES